MPVTTCQEPAFHEAGDMVQLIKSIDELRTLLHSTGYCRKNIGFVPTMGYLHKGHLELVERAKKLSDVVVVSIFVNPTQFGENEDFNVYPRDRDRDIKLLSEFAPLIIFAPTGTVMYPKGYCSWVDVECLENRLCGLRRPKHFRGVATVIAKLLNIITPDLMFMGEKDYQQVVILEKMISDLNFNTKIIRCATVREADGLAMSSRNQYLTPAERERAAVIYRSLVTAKKMFADGTAESSVIKSEIKAAIEDAGGVLDYVEVVDSLTLENIDKAVAGCRIVVAAFFGNTRLIDNIGL